jgi:hypothetical protein
MAVSLAETTSIINTYFSLGIFPIAIVLNSFSFYVFSRPRLNKTNMGFLNRWQLGIDIILLFSNSLFLRSNTAITMSFYTLDDTACRLLTYFRRFILHASS